MGGFDTFLSNLETCKATLDWKGLSPEWKFGPWGEDLFMQKCMDKHGVSKVFNFSMSKNPFVRPIGPRNCRKRKDLWLGRLTLTRVLGPQLDIARADAAVKDTLGPHGFLAVREADV